MASPSYLSCANCVIRASCYGLYMTLQSFVKRHKKPIRTLTNCVLLPGLTLPGFDHRTFVFPKWNGNFSYVEVIGLVATIWPCLCSLPCWATSSLQLNLRDIIEKTSGRVPAYKIKETWNSVLLPRDLNIISWHIFLSARYISSV